MTHPELPVPGPGDILQAANRIRQYVHRTPVLSSGMIDSIVGASLLFKCENFQKVGAFKARGATNAVLSLSPDELSKGICTHSSGNHAQALSWAARQVGAKAFIVMPSNSSKVKVEAVRGYGGIITFCEPTLEARETTLKQVMEHTGALEIHPYNDPRIVAGQATAALELIQQSGPLDLIVAPVGGGGLLGGTALSARYFGDGTPVAGAEPLQADDAYQSFTRKEFVPSRHPDTIADGLRTSLGTLTFPIILEHVSAILRTPEAQIARAMRLIWERMKILVEPSAAVPLAALLEEGESHRGKRIGIILSGGNVDLDHLPWI